MKNNQIIKNIAINATLCAILFIQEQILQILPNIQLTVFLIILYSKTLKLKNTIIIIAISTILDNILLGSIHLIPVMLIGWLSIAAGIYIFFKKCENPIILGGYAIIGSITYAAIFMLYNVLTFQINIYAYILADIPYTIVLALSSFLSVIWLYAPLKTITSKFIDKGEK